jgi:FdhD protein
MKLRNRGKIMREIKVSRINVLDNTINEKNDYVAEDKPIHIFINNIHYGTIICTPTQLTELVIGHLFAEGLIQNKEEIEKFGIKKDEKYQIFLKPNIDANKRISKSQRFARIIVSSCGNPNYRPLKEIINELPKIGFTSSVSAKILSDSVKNLNFIAKKFRKTGGVHVAAIYSLEGELKALAEDVGRHNAVDKVIGISLIKNFNLNDYFLAISGRLTGDIVLKVARAKIPIVASLSAAIMSGIETAKLTKITLVGFVRGKTLNVYTHKNRVLLINGENH